MSTRRIELVGLCALALGVLGVIWVVPTSSRRISLTILNFTAKRWPDDIAQRMSSRDYVVATVVFSNASSRVISYWGYGSDCPTYTRLYQTPMGWKEPARGFVCGTGLERCTLAPSQAITFETVVDRDKPCKIALNYTDEGTRSQLWQRFPGWLTQRLPWARPWRTVTTDAIEVTSAVSAVGLTVKPQEPFLKPPEETDAVQAAAQSGDADAQFRLAGRYFTGSGIEKSLTEALRWFEAAATNGHVEAAYNVGTIYEYGLGTTPDEARAIEWYRRASERGHRSAQERLRAFAAR